MNMKLMERVEITCDDNCLNVIVRENTAVTISVLKQINRIIIEYGEFKAIVIKLEPFLFVDKDTREYMSKLHKRFLNCPIAVISNSFDEDLLARFYRNFHKPISPYNIFKCKADAIKWMDSMLQ